MLRLVPTRTAIEKVLPFIRRLQIPQDTERLWPGDAVGRVLAEDVVASIEVPSFTRSTVDGYAVRASDTFGASEGLPAILPIAGEVKMGKPAGSLPAGSAVEIPTGGMLPEGADAVVMVEYTEALGDGSVAVYSPVAPGDNVIVRGEDFQPGGVIVPAGRKLRPMDVAAIAAVGVARVTVFRKLSVFVLSTGDELRPPGEVPGDGEIFDINGLALCGMIHNEMMKPVFGGIVRDDPQRIRETLKKGLESCDAAVVSGGTSAGPADVIASVIDELGEPGVLVHGLAMRPGKPTVIGVVSGKPVLGLAGHPASAMMVFEVVARPILNALAGRTLTADIQVGRVLATLTRAVSSRAGREDFIRCTLRYDGGKVFAEPVMGKSGLVTTMLKASGYFKVPLEKEGFAAGDTVEVTFFGGSL